MIKELITLSNQLDSLGLNKQADIIDNIIRTASDSECSGGEFEFAFHFERNKYKLVNDPEPNDLVSCLINEGMQHDRKFIYVDAGTSGTGTTEQNSELMWRRANEGLRWLYDSHAPTGPNGLPYSFDEFKNKASLTADFNTDRPRSTLDTNEEVPLDDPDHKYFQEHQFIYIKVGPITPTPNFDSLARRFYDATIGRSMPGTDDDMVHEVLMALRDANDFGDFNNKLKRTYDMDFYEIACHKGTEGDYGLGKMIDEPIGFIVRYLQKKWKEHGPTELSQNEAALASHIERLQIDDIKCTD